MRFTIKNLYWIDLLILGLTLIIMVVGISNYGLYEPHEGHFAMVGQEMLWRNDWIVPHLNGSPYLNKPPLLYWLIAFSTNIFGSTEFAARLPIALSGWLGIIIAWKWTRELWGINASRIAALMLSVTLGWFIFTHQILIDVLLGSLLLSSSYFLWQCLYKPRSWFYWWSAYISLALCVLTKGLIGGVFPLFGYLALIIVRQDWKIIQRIKLYKGLLLVLAVIIPWFVALELSNPGFLHYFIINEHFDRLLDRRFPPDYEVSKVSAVGYLAITACWCFPWILFFPSVVKFTWQEWRRGFMGNASILDRKNSDGIFLLAVGAMLPVILFLPLSSRLIYYSIPAIPPYVILCAGWWNKNYGKPVKQVRHSKAIDYSIEKKQLPQLDRTSKVSTLCQSPVKVITSSSPTKVLNLYGAIAVVLAIGCYATIPFIPTLINVLPPVLQTPEITWLMLLVAIALGTGWLVSGIGIFKSFASAWLPLFVALVITYAATIRGFVLFQDIRSSKTLVTEATSCLSQDTLWIFEGSREIGAAGAISYYLNQNQNHNFPDNSYQTVMVLADGGKNRLPPQFPGSTPEYLLTQTQLRQYWYGDRPVVFLTDFLRLPNNPQDPANLNLPEANIQPDWVQGQRKLYLNQVARANKAKQCNFIDGQWTISGD